MSEEETRRENKETFRPNIPGTPDEIARGFGISEEARDNPLIQSFLERRSRRVSATGEQPERPAYRPITPTTAEQIAERFGIPQVNREHPAAQEFAHLAAALDTLTDATAIANSSHDRTAQPGTLAAARELFHAPDMTLTLQDRYAVVSSLLVAAREILGEGMGDIAVDAQPHAFRNLRDAMDRLGYDLRLEKQPPTVYRFDDAIDE